MSVSISSATPTSRSPRSKRPTGGQDVARRLPTSPRIAAHTGSAVLEADRRPPCAKMKSSLSHNWTCSDLLYKTSSVARRGQRQQIYLSFGLCPCLPRSGFRRATAISADPRPRAGMKDRHQLVEHRSGFEAERTNRFRSLDDRVIPDGGLLPRSWFSTVR
jgi:hypothetical protein